jgi:TolB-like protein/class 3 adenylate cyclase
MATRSRLAVILHADVVGSTTLVQIDERVAHERMHDAFQRFSDAIASYGGTTHELRGDALVAEFSRASDALSAAIAFQVGNREYNEKLEGEIRPEVRTGVALGEVVVADRTVTGTGVVLAQRLEQLAQPGCTVIQGSIYESVPRRFPFAYENLGEIHLKGFDEPTRAYAVTLAESGELPRPELDQPPPVTGEANAAAKRASIAVLPFDNLSSDPEQGYFADGMVEEIITGLARIRWLTVIARNSTFAYKGTSPDVRKVGWDLSVRYVVKGSVRKAGTNVRISAQLVEADTGGHLWAERFNGALDDVFDLQDQITAGVVAAIEPSVRQAEIERAKRKRPENLDAYDLYLRALEQSYIFTPAARSTGLSLLDAAIALEPDYVEAHGVAAFCLQQRYLWGGRAPTDREAALRHAEAVAGARTDDATALAFAALALSALDGRHDVALVMVDRALERNPSSAIAHNVSALIYMILGQPETSVFHAERSLRLSPFDPLRHIPECALAVAKLAAGQYEAALVCARRAVEANPLFTPGLTTLALCLVRLGRIEEARATVHRLVEIAPDTRIATLEERYLFANALSFDHIAADLRVVGLPE